MNTARILQRVLLLGMICLLPVSCSHHPFRLQAERLSISATSLSFADIFAEQPSTSSERNQAYIDPYLDDFFLRAQEKQGFNGVVLVAEQGSIRHAGAYGYANFKKKDSLHLGSVFQLASVSKIFTSTAILMLYEEGSLLFDDPVVQHIPEFPYPDITIRHLLTHRSGLCRYMGLGDQYWDKKKVMSNEDMLNLLIAHQPKLWFEPGSRYLYINTNYAVLGLIIERITHQPFAEFIQHRIFEPLDMQESYVATHIQRRKIPHIVTGYKRIRRRNRDAGGDYVDGVFGDKGIYASARDLLKFDDALYHERLVSSSTLLYAYQPSSSSKRRNNHYGFGWRMRRDIPDLVYHFGWWRGFRTCLIRDLQAERTVIILSNQDHQRFSVPYWEVYHSLNRMPS
ncbi:MAG: serine hydrolase domain-containing protein [Bacteroidota bacterium]